jgi:pimeloyl-ACP methyl ester carboxylesterase
MSSVAPTVPTMDRERRTRTLRYSTAVLAAVLMVAGCSSDDSASGGGAGDDRQDTTATSEVPAEVQQYDGSVEGFYEVPDPLPEGEPGQLIRVQEVGDADGMRTVRVMYHSRDSQDRDRAVTGVVTHPVGDAPEDGWPIVATAPGTIGLASTCAISRQGNPVGTFGVEGIGVLTDYIGMGPPGETQAYLSRKSEGHSVLDGARAARQLLAGDASDRLLVFGHSQGGHGAQSAHELAGDYAPELQLLGTVSGAPAAMFDRSYGAIDDIVSSIVMTMGLYGVATDHPEVDPADYLGAEALELESVLDTACLDEVIQTFVPVALSDGYWAQDPATTEPARSVLLANDVGNVAVDAPLLLISGTADERVVHARVMDLFERLCEVGQVTELIVLEGANHGNEVPRAQQQIEDWFAARLAGEPASNSCASAP